MKNFAKMLCLLIISMFIIGFGGEVVKAETFTTLGTLKYRKWGPGTSLDNYTYFQHIQLNGQDAYCLNRTMKFPRVSLTLMEGLVPANKEQAIINVINAGTAKNLGLTHGEAYYLTQAAVWFQLGGVDDVDDKTDVDGINVGFYNWILSNYPEQWKKLMDAATEKPIEYNLTISGTDSVLTESDGYLVSKDFKVSSNISGNFVVAIDSGSSEGACVLYNSSCSTSVEVPANTAFKIRVDKPTDSSGTVDASFTATPKNDPNPTGYTLKTYGGASSQGFQNVAIVDSVSESFSDVQVVSGNYTNTTDVEIQKIDSETSKKVSGASLAVYKSNGAKIGIYTSTGEGEANPVLSLPIGDYYLREISAPEGYLLNNEKQNFSIVDDNGTLKVKQGDAFVDSATIVLSNNPLMVKFRKVDSNGNPIEGVKFIIEASPMHGASSAKSLLCAYSDKDGYLTVPCDDSEVVTNSRGLYAEVSSDGVYRLGIDFGSSSQYYNITEETSNKYDASTFNDVYDLDFYVSGKSFIIYNHYISVEATDGNIPMFIVTMENENYLDISKTDITTGAEIAGAHLRVYDPEASIDSSDDDSSTSDNVIDEWVSEEGKTHRVSGIKFDKFYAIEETIAPEGYIAVTTTVWFKVAEDGTVTTYDPDTQEVISDLTGSNYKLLVPNDYTKVQISKTDMVTGEEVPGAELKICTASDYDENGMDCTPSKSEWLWTSGTEAHYIEKLVAGDYYLIETIAPEGYVKKTTAVKFTVKEETGIQTVVMENEPTKVSVSKKDFTTGEELPGATLQILKEDRTQAYDNDGNKLEWISGTEPYVIYGLPVGNYILIETIPPEYYKEGMIVEGQAVTEYAFSVTEEEPNVEIEVYNQILTDVPSTGVSTINIIAIGGLMIFVGYQVIKLYRRRLY